MSSREKPMTKIAVEFCRAWLGKHCFAPFTGQDWSAWMAFVYSLELYGRGDKLGQDCGLIMMKESLAAAQNKSDVHELFIQTIPAVLDWSFVEQIWPKIAYPDALSASVVGDPRATERARQ